jgi:hypothetical protein
MSDSANAEDGAYMAIIILLNVLTQTPQCLGKHVKGRWSHQSVLSPCGGCLFVLLVCYLEEKSVIQQILIG